MPYESERASIPCRPATLDPPVILTVPRCSDAVQTPDELKDWLFLVSANLDTWAIPACAGQQIAIPGASPGATLP